MLNKREDVEVALENAEALFMDGLDDAIIGVGRRQGQPSLVAYDEEKIIDVLMDKHAMTYEEAWEYYEFNVAGSWMGEHTPIILSRKG